ncbi:MAG: hypothetical protein IPN64_13790 [Propionivibrio sp.]|uniref:hypothetical protein n=1 Tax=Propionivibrio sp. TaxID=2212460 RepID=UPI0025E07C8C|nr:hypothetical protein [Propionivibrio sp.]MBK8895056.1 hypothetical protein [Propionivibrio sp.]
MPNASALSAIGDVAGVEDGNRTALRARAARATVADEARAATAAVATGTRRHDTVRAFAMGVDRRQRLVTVTVADPRAAVAGIAAEYAAAAGRARAALALRENPYDACQARCHSWLRSIRRAVNDDVAARTADRRILQQAGHVSVEVRLQGDLATALRGESCDVRHRLRSCPCALPYPSK